MSVLGQRAEQVKDKGLHTKATLKCNLFGTNTSDVSRSCSMCSFLIVKYTKQKPKKAPTSSLKCILDCQS